MIFKSEIRVFLSLSFLVSILSFAILNASPTTIPTYIIKKDGTGSFTTIQAAVDALPTVLAGNYVIEVQDDSTYYEQVDIRKDNNNDIYSLTIRAGDGFQPTINGDDYGFYIKPDSTSNLKNVTISGFNITSCNINGFFATRNGADGEVLNLTITNCIIHGTASEGIKLEYADDFLMRNSILYDAGGDYGVHFNHCDGNPRFINNTVYTLSTTYSLYQVYGSLTLMNNIICNTSDDQYDYGFRMLSGTTYSYNNYFCSKYSFVNGSYNALGRGDREADLDDDPPLFYSTAPDSEDFHLKSEYGRWEPEAKGWQIDATTSPCIDMGLGDPIDEVAPNGNIINQGAYGGTDQASKSGPARVYVTKGSGAFGNFGAYAMINGAVAAIPDTLDTSYTVTVCSDEPYREEVKVFKHNPSDSGYSLTIEASDTNNPVIEAEENGFYLKPINSTDDMSNVTIDGFEIAPCHRSESITSRSILAENNGAGIEVINLTVQNCIIHGSNNEGIKLEYADDFLVRNNAVYDAGGDYGIHFHQCDGNSRFINNTVYTYSTINSVYQAYGYLTLMNNIICNTSDDQYDYGFRMSSGFTYSCNNYFCSKYSLSNGSDNNLGFGDREADLDDDPPLFYSTTPGSEDFHLMSEYGRWDSEAKGWQNDGVTSPCIDMGLGEPVDEFAPSGNIINQGAYGGTNQASKSGPTRVYVTKGSGAFGNLGAYTQISAAVNAIPDTLDTSYTVTVCSNGPFKQEVYIIKHNPPDSGYTLTIEASDTNKPVIEAEKRGFYLKPYNDTADLANITIDGFEISPCHRSTSITRRGIFAEKNTDWIGVINLTIKNCIIHGTNNDGIILEYADDFMMQNNIIYDTGSNYGIHLFVCHGSPEFINNTVYTNSISAAVYSNGGSLTLRNNIICNLNTGQYSYGFNYSSTTLQTSYTYFCSKYARSNGSNAVLGRCDREADLDDDPPLFYSTTPGNEDFHLKSEYGRWNPATTSWELDAVTSPCIDMGFRAPVNEPLPNGGVINQGGFGGTEQASKSDSGRVYVTIGSGVFGNYGIYTTINGAIAAIPDSLDSSYTVTVCSDGPYREEIDVLKLNPSENGYSLTIEASDTNNPVIEAEIYGFYLKPYSSSSDLANVTIDGFEIKPCQRSASVTSRGILAQKDSDGIEVINLTIQNCVIHGISNEGIRLEYSDDYLIRNCLVYNSGTDYAVYLTYCEGDPIFINNTVYSGNSFCAVYKHYGSLNLMNNIICNTSDDLYDYGFRIAGNIPQSSNNYFCAKYALDHGSDIALGCGDREADLDDDPPLFYSITPDSEDFHLMSQYGRWNPATISWEYDAVTSPCLDMGFGAPVNEPLPNGGIINQGFYGGTDQASKSGSARVYVTKGSGAFGNFGAYTQISGAVNAIPDSLDSNYTITVCSDGPYREEVNIFKLNPASNGYDLVIEASDTNKPVIEAEKYGFYLKPYNNTNDLANVIISGLEIKPCHRNPAITNKGIFTERNDAENHVLNLTVENCVIHGITNEGIRLEYADGFLVQNCLVYNCGTAYGVYFYYCDDDPHFMNSTVYTNSNQYSVISYYSDLILRNNIICNTSEIAGDYGFYVSGVTVESSYNYYCSKYSLSNGSYVGIGRGDREAHLDDDPPLFYSTTPDSEDFHLISEYGRWNPITETWELDAVTSPCIDMGFGAPLNEPLPNGGIINQGFYGGTDQASKSGPARVYVTRGAGAFGNYGAYTQINGAVNAIPDSLDTSYAVSVCSDGPFRQEVNVFKLNPASNGYNLIIEASDTNKPVIEAEAHGFYLQPYNNTNDLANVTIDGFEIAPCQRDASITSRGIFTQRNDSDNEVINLTIENCIIHGSRYEGIKLEYSDNFQIKNSLIYSCGTDYGVFFYYCDGDCRFVNNTVYTYSTINTLCQNYGNLTLLNNIICNTSDNAGDYGFNNPSGITSSSYNYFCSKYSLSSASLVALGRGDKEAYLEEDPPLFYSTTPDSEDFHLMSEYGRWNPISESWEFDAASSPCIDMGFGGPVLEPFPNGGIINQGCYGGTDQASKSGPARIYVTKGSGAFGNYGTFTQISGAVNAIPDSLDSSYTVTVCSGGPFQQEVKVFKLNPASNGYSLIIEASDTNKPVIEAEAYGFYLKSYKNTNDLANVTIDGFEIVPCQRDPNITSRGIFTQRNDSDNEVINLTIRNCIIHGTINEGIKLEYSDAFVAQSNLVYNCGTDYGIYFYYCDGDCKFANNTVYTNSAINSLCQFYGTLTIWNNIICNCSDFDNDYAFNNPGGATTTSYNYYCCKYSLEDALGYPSTGRGDREADLDDDPPLFYSTTPGSEDFHLMSEYGRWDPEAKGWEIDVVTSPCIDMGFGAPMNEPLPNGNIINQGFYGGTDQASKSGPSRVYVTRDSGAFGNFGAYTQISGAVNAIQDSLDSSYTVTVCSDGPYREEVKVFKLNPASNGYNLVIEASDTNKPVIEAEVYGFYLKSYKNTNDLANVTIDGFEIVPCQRSADISSMGIFTQENGDENEVINLTLENCVTHGIKNEGIKLEYADDFLVQNCLVYDCGDNYAVTFYGCDGDCRFINNTVYSDNSIYTVNQGYGNLNLRNNIICNTSDIIGDYGFRVSSGVATPSFNYFCSAYSADQGSYGALGTGDTEVDLHLAPPLFVNTATDSENFHLQSMFGHWDTETGVWLFDTLTSPCIDAGDPADPYANETEDNGNRINQGAYGNTVEASKSGFGDTNIVAILIETTDCNFEITYRGQTVVSADSQKIEIINIGTLPIDIGMFCDSVPGYALADTYEIGYYGLWGLLNDSDFAPAKHDFTNNHLFSYILQWADSTIFGPGGRNIPIAGDNQENLWFRFDAPYYYAPHNIEIKVTVQAREHLP
ncbi:right-handed parallel beta-helix repeat-containing protein [bacterium]|nr:right-handed parallel beta-helix repeat-containing protein [bacterium]